MIAQGYMKQKVQEGDLAPENKASDLNTAAWVFSQEPESVPERIRDQVRELPWSKCCATIIDKYGVCWWISI